MWNTETDAEERFRNKAIWGSAVAVVLIAAGAFAYFHYFAHPTAEATAVVAKPNPAPAATEAPAIQNPVPPPPEGRSLPALNDSDQELKDSLVGLVGPKPVEQFLVP